MPISFSVFDDSDIKIAGDRPSEQIFNRKDDPQDDIAELLHIQRENGNLDKARELGKRVAIDICNLKMSEEYPENVLLEIKTLCAFVVDHALNSLLPNSIVSQTANNEYMTSLKNIDESFYDYIQMAGSYSRYVLHSRKSDLLGKRVSKSFAKFVGYENDVLWEEKGIILYNEWMDNLKNKIEFYKFMG